MAASRPTYGWGLGGGAPQETKIAIIVLPSSIGAKELYAKELSVFAALEETATPGDADSVVHEIECLVEQSCRFC